MGTTKPSHLAKDMEHVAATSGHVKPLLQAFGPLLLEKERWLTEQPQKKENPITRDSFAKGTSLIQQGVLFSDNDPWQSAGASASCGIGRGFPQFAEDMARLSQAISAGSVNCFRLVSDSGRLGEEDLAILAEQIGIDLFALQLFLDLTVKFVFSLKARDLSPSLADIPWGKGYCPVCASLPNLALIREKGQRFLQCGQCSHEWLFPRLACPACGHEDPQDGQFLFVEGSETDGAFICSNCRRYLITSNRSGSLRQVSADLIAISLSHLDIILQNNGFQPMEKA